MALALALAGLALGAAATPHCAFMCSAPCAAFGAAGVRGGAAFHLGRLASYMAGGALAASSVSTLGAWARASVVLQPLWTTVQLAFLALGLWWLVAGRMPQRLARADVARPDAIPLRFVARRGRAWRAGTAGLAWVAWPCGALQGALLLAALADDAAGGALVMAAFALASAPALAAAPWLWARMRRAQRGPAASARAVASAYRIAGLALVLSTGWALGRLVHERVLAACQT